MKFVRFGGLSSVYQEQYKAVDKSFHNPPKKRGCYAFVYGYIDKFLIGTTYEPGHISNKSYWLRDDNGNKIKCDDLFYTVKVKKSYSIEFISKISPIYIKLLKKQKIKVKDINCYKGYTFVLKKPKVFEYNGEIWHHLGENLKPEQIIESNGSWVKTSMGDFELALKIEYKKLLKDKHKTDKEFNILNFKGKQNPFNPSFGIKYNKDHLEVFIEKIN